MDYTAQRARGAAAAAAGRVNTHLGDSYRMRRHCRAYALHGLRGARGGLYELFERFAVLRDGAQDQTYELWIESRHSVYSSLVREIPTTGPLSFGYRRSATHVHQGVDLGAPEGAPLHAPWAGTITRASAKLAPGFSGYGGHVVIDSPIGYWLFGHLSAVHVRPGQRVQKGQHIGDVGRTCYSTEDPGALCDGPHVHVELSRTPYPQDSAAPRLDPVGALEAAGGRALLFQGQPAVPPSRVNEVESGAKAWLVLLGLLGSATAGALLFARLGRK